jgi:hypothetical protein
MYRKALRVKQNHASLVEDAEMIIEQALPEQDRDDAMIQKMESAQFRAVSGNYHGFGVTPQEAVGDLMAMLPGDPPTAIVVWPFNRGDAFFTGTQIARLRELRQRRETLIVDEYHELERLVEASFEATIARVQSLPTLK